MKPTGAARADATGGDVLRDVAELALRPTGRNPRRAAQLDVAADKRVGRRAGTRSRVTGMNGRYAALARRRGAEATLGNSDGGGRWRRAASHASVKKARMLRPC